MTPETAATIDMQQWVDRLRAGDTTARDELLRGVERRLYALASRMLKQNPRVARWVETGDVLQTASLRLLKALEQVTPASMRDFFNLAAVQIRRELIDLARHYYGPLGTGANHDSQGDAGTSLLAMQPAVEPQLEQWTRFHEAVEKLPAEEREVVSLVFYHGWTQEQVAELFQVHLRTIRRWWQAALLQLHNVLKSDMLKD